MRPSKVRCRYLPPIIDELGRACSKEWCGMQPFDPGCASTIRAQGALNSSAYGIPHVCSVAITALVRLYSAAQHYYSRGQDFPLTSRVHHLQIRLRTKSAVEQGLCACGCRKFGRSGRGDLTPPTRAVVRATNRRSHTYCRSNGSGRRAERNA